MFKELIALYLQKFYEIGEPFLKTICNCSVPTKIILSEYVKLPPIESMPDKEKKEMKLYVIAMFPEKTIEEKLICCKVIYTIGTLL